MGENILKELLQALKNGEITIRITPAEEKNEPYGMIKAMNYIREYCETEFGPEDHPDFSEMHNIPLAFTTTEDGEHEIQAIADLLNYRITTYVDGTALRVEKWDNIEEMAEDGLYYLDFSDLTYISDYELEEFKKKIAESKPRQSMNLLRVKTGLNPIGGKWKGWIHDKEKK